MKSLAFHKSFAINIFSSVQFVSFSQSITIKNILLINQNQYYFIKQLKSIAFQHSIAINDISTINYHERYVINQLKTVNVFGIISCNQCHFIQSIAINMITITQQFSLNILINLESNKFSQRITSDLLSTIRSLIRGKILSETFVSSWKTIHSTFSINCFNILHYTIIEQHHKLTWSFNIFSQHSCNKVQHQHRGIKYQVLQRSSLNFILQVRMFVL